MKFRLYLAAMHYNYNADRPQAKDKKGNPATSVYFPKFKDEGQVRIKKVPAKYGMSELTVLHEMITKKLF